MVDDNVELAIRKLLTERDGLREQVCFLMNLVDRLACLVLSALLPEVVNEGLDRWWRLRRELERQEWFRELDREREQDEQLRQ